MNSDLKIIKYSCEDEDGRDNCYENPWGDYIRVCDLEEWLSNHLRNEKAYNLYSDLKKVLK